MKEKGREKERESSPERFFPFKVKCFIVCRINGNPPRCSCTAQTSLNSFHLHRNTLLAQPHLTQTPAQMHKKRKKQTAQRQSDMTPVEAAGQRLSSERLFFCSPGVSLHSSAAQTGSVRSFTHPTLLPSTLLGASLSIPHFITLIHCFKQVRGLSQAGRRAGGQGGQKAF